MNYTHPAIQKKVEKLQQELEQITKKRIVVLISVEPEMKLDYDKLVMAVCLVVGVTYAQVLTGLRKKSYALTRHLICYYAYSFSGLSFKSIADKLGLENHTSVMHAYRRIKYMIQKNDQSIADIVSNINNALVPTQQ